VKTLVKSFQEEKENPGSKGPEVEACLVYTSINKERGGKMEFPYLHSASVNR
jgi:hypothetical protein